MTSSLDKIKKWVYNCIRCSNCKYLPEDAGHEKSCPAGSKFKFESYYGSGKVWIARNILTGDIEFTDSVIQKIYACPTCGNCEHICGMEVSEHLVDIFEALREAAVDAGKGPLPQHKVFGESIEAEHNPYKEKHADRTKWMEGLNVPEKDQAEVLFFVGCTSAYRQQDLAKATVKVLNKIGVDFTVSKDEWCCGSPLMRTGQIKLAKELVKNNLDLIKKIGANTVLTSCAGCFRTLKIDYPKYADALEGVEILHLTEYLQKLIKEGKINFPKEFNKKVTYHDPCHLGRHSEVYDAPRDIIKAIPGIELIEMPRNKETAWCCGAGGGVKAGFGDWALEISTERIEEAEKLGIDVLLSACPFCKTNLSDAIKAKGSNIKFMDIMNVLDEIL